MDHWVECSKILDRLDRRNTWRRIGLFVKILLVATGLHFLGFIQTPFAWLTIVLKLGVGICGWELLDYAFARWWIKLIPTRWNELR